MTCVQLLSQAKFEFKDVKRPKFSSATSNLRVEQNLVHLGRFCILAKKWLE